MGDGDGIEKVHIEEAKMNGGVLGFLKSAWKAMVHNVQAWFWKLMFTIISTKVLVTVGAIYVLYWLMTHHHKVQQMTEDGGLVTLDIPYLPGEPGGGFIRDAAIALIGARVLQTVISIGQSAVDKITKNGTPTPKYPSAQRPEEYEGDEDEGA